MMTENTQDKKVDAPPTLCEQKQEADTKETQYDALTLHNWRNSWFLQLPPEIRNQIYETVIGDANRDVRINAQHCCAEFAMDNPRQKRSIWDHNPQVKFTTRVQLFTDLKCVSPEGAEGPEDLGLLFPSLAPHVLDSLRQDKLQIPKTYNFEDLPFYNASIPSLEEDGEYPIKLDLENNDTELGTGSNEDQNSPYDNDHFSFEGLNRENTGDNVDSRADNEDQTYEGSVWSDDEDEYRFPNPVYGSSDELPLDDKEDIPDENLEFLVKLRYDVMQEDTTVIDAMTESDRKKVKALQKYGWPSLEERKAINKRILNHSCRCKISTSRALLQTSRQIRFEAGPIFGRLTEFTLHLGHARNDLTNSNFNQLAYMGRYGRELVRTLDLHILSDCHDIKMKSLGLDYAQRAGFLVDQLEEILSGLPNLKYLRLHSMKFSMVPNSELYKGLRTRLGLPNLKVFRSKNDHFSFWA